MIPLGYTRASVFCIQTFVIINQLDSGFGAAAAAPAAAAAAAASANV